MTALLATPLAGAAAGGHGTSAIERKPSHSEDLFSAHNFDITINLNIPAPGAGKTTLSVTVFALSCPVVIRFGFARN